MNRDATVIQAAILLIIIAILGIAIVQKQQASNQPVQTQSIVSTQPGTDPEDLADNAVAVPEAVAEQPDEDEIIVSGAEDIVTKQPMTEQLNSANANIVRAYFKAMGEENFSAACDMMSPAKCASIRPTAVALFSQEYQKLINGYEYLSIKDYGQTAPSGKDVVCVKYSYRYIEDANPRPISEVLSFYVDDVDGQRKITDRVCEKKYKEGSGVRPCPVEANQNFCVGLIK